MRGRDKDIFADRNKQRRSQYHHDEGGREAKKADSRAQYRGKVQKTANPPAPASVRRGIRREVDNDDMDTPAVVESYTIPEAAEAMGKAVNTFRRWIADEMLPGPYLKDTQSGYSVYSRGELDIIAEALRVHALEFSYFRADHSTVIHQINQRIQAYRSMHI